MGRNRQLINLKEIRIQSMKYCHKSKTEYSSKLSLVMNTRKFASILYGKGTKDGLQFPIDEFGERRTDEYEISKEEQHF